eukprot:gene11802-8113_t
MRTCDLSSLSLILSLSLCTFCSILFDDTVLSGGTSLLPRHPTSTLIISFSTFPPHIYILIVNPSITFVFFLHIFQFFFFKFPVFVSTSLLSIVCFSSRYPLFSDPSERRTGNRNRNSTKERHPTTHNSPHTTAVSPAAVVVGTDLGFMKSHHNILAYVFLITNILLSPPTSSLSISTLISPTQTNLEFRHVLSPDYFIAISFGHLYLLQKEGRKRYLHTQKENINTNSLPASSELAVETKKHQHGGFIFIFFFRCTASASAATVLSPTNGRSDPAARLTDHPSLGKSLPHSKQGSRLENQQRIEQGKRTWRDSTHQTNDTH